MWLAVACLSVLAATHAREPSAFASPRAASHSWRIPALPRVTSTVPATLSGIACNTPTSCFATGSSAGRSALMLRWNGSRWSQASLPALPLSRDDLLSVACGSAKSCLAVGEAYSSSRTLAVALSWNGTGWKVVSPGAPHSGGSLLRAVACTSSSSCWAVGSSMSASGASVPIIWSWNHSRWVRSTLPAAPAGRELSLSRVTCAGAGACFAAGQLLNTTTFASQPEILRLRGQKWTAQKLPIGAGQYLEDISCGSSHLCFAVGLTEASGGSSRNLVLRWSGSKWSKVSVSNPGTSQPSDALLSIACSHSGPCVTLGQSVADRGSGQASLFGFKVFQGRWIPVSVSRPGTAGYPEPTGIACPASSLCLAVGLGAQGSPSAPPVSGVFSLRWQGGSSWSVTQIDVTMQTAARLDGIACPGKKSCLAVGYYRDLVRDVVQPLALRWNGSHWTNQSLPYVIAYNQFQEPAGGGLLNGMGCSSASECWAVGHQFNSSGVPQTLILRWNGSSWRAVASPDPGFPSEPGSLIPYELTAAACAGPADCWAVGVGYQRTPESIQENPLAIHWNGSSWAVVDVPQPAEAGGQGVNDEQLDGVACAAGSACWIVGSAELASNGLDVPAALVAHSGALTDRSPRAEASDETLNGISCPTSRFCLAVGAATNDSGWGKPIAMARHGFSFKPLKLPASAAGNGYGDLQADACTGTTSCEAVGYRDRGGAAEGVALSWNGSGWTSAFAGGAAGLAGDSALSGVGCVASFGCFAAGSRMLGATTQPLIVELPR